MSDAVRRNCTSSYFLGRDTLDKYTVTTNHCEWFHSYWRIGVISSPFLIRTSYSENRAIYEPVAQSDLRDKRMIEVYLLAHSVTCHEEDDAL